MCHNTAFVLRDAQNPTPFSRHETVQTEQQLSTNDIFQAVASINNQQHSVIAHICIMYTHK